ncbi:hypothetical protein [Herbiconiux sp.]|uniref:hypothetical protein n=1 Tax=Herbiconiux sp. TaxID=1871186 RepID=UPI0025C517FC|nr:hypothetical protein [Herbiconiux sp.]
MRCITYAGGTLLTTDDVAEHLIDLTAALADRGKAKAVEIPIVPENGEGPRTAELVIGVGNDVLSVPQDWDGEEPDFSADAARLEDLLKKQTPTATAVVIPDDEAADYYPEDYPV